MKKRIIILVLTLFVAIVSTKAQESIYVKQTNGTISETPLNLVRKITFSGTDMILHKTSGTDLIWATSDVQKYYFDLSTSVNEIEQSNDIVLYPNPSNGNFNINYQLKQKGNITISVLAIDGRLIEQKRFENINTGEHTFNWNSNLNSGNYIVKIQSEDNFVTKKLIILK